MPLPTAAALEARFVAHARYVVPGVLLAMACVLGGGLLLTLYAPPAGPLRWAGRGVLIAGFVAAMWHLTHRASAFGLLCPRCGIALTGPHLERHARATARCLRCDAALAEPVPVPPPDAA